MIVDSTQSEDLSRDKSFLGRTCVFAVAFLLCFFAIWLLSRPYEYGSDLTRPTLGVTGLLLLSSIFAFFGLLHAIKVTSTRQLMLLIVGVAISARLVALFTCPILEIDYYRYMWDGKVLAEGVSPYRFSPEQILELPSVVEGDLEKLNLLSVQSESNYTILSRIHFEDHTTIYPPVSQLVFCATMILVPDSASVEAHIFAMKFALILFDLGALLLTFLLLKLVRLHCGWLIVYAWNPLVIKEVANGGHLDSIAVFFTVLSVFALARWYESEFQRKSLLIASAVSLGLGVGAKLFPVVVFPALLVAIFRKRRIAVVSFSAVFFVVVAISLWPMFSSIVESQSLQSAEVQTEEVSRVETGPIGKAANSEGLTSFLSQWRMNDVVFSTVYLNLKDIEREPKRKPWFVVTNEDFRDRFCDWFRENNLGGDNPAFFATRIVTLSLFSVFYLWQLVSLSKMENRNDQWFAAFLSRIGWIIVVFLVLQPTVNPWYLLWAAPFLCFSKNPGWIFVSGALLIYYTRFWFQSLSESFEFGGTIYKPVGIYDFLIVWGVYFIVVIALVGFSITNRWGRIRQN